MENTEFEIQTRHELSFASLCFMAPLINVYISRQEIDISESDKKFINGYRKLGYINILLLLGSGAFGLLSSFYGLIYFSYVSFALLFIIIAIIFRGIFMIFSDNIIMEGESNGLKFKEINAGNLDIIFYYLPIFNFYLWYNRDENLKSYRWLKESIIFWTFTIILGYIFPNSYLIMTMLFIAIIRIATLLGGIDLIEDKYKEKLDKVFDKNPEELIGYIKGSIMFFIDKLKYMGKQLTNDPIIYIDIAKKEYSYLSQINQTQIIIEYSILILLITYILYQNYDNLYFGGTAIIEWIPFIIFIGRYLSMIPSKRMSYLPGIHEIVVTIRKIIKL